MRFRPAITGAALAAVLACNGCLIPLPSDFNYPIRTVSLDPLPPRDDPGETPLPGTGTSPATASTATVSCFSPDEACAGLIIKAIDASKVQIRVQAYSFTSADIAAALMRAERRGVDVRVIIDRRHAFEHSGKMPELAQAGIPVAVDSVAGIAHSKVMIIDERLVITGSYNFTASAEHHNAENLVLILDPNLADRYLANWYKRDAESR